MSKKFQRVFRSGHLTPEEVARDQDVRRKVQAEFPPAKSSVPDSSASLSATLQRAIQPCGQPVAEIAANAGVSEIVVAQFLAGERDIRMATADKLAEALGMKLSANL